MPDTVPLQVDTSQQQSSATEGNQILLSLLGQRNQAQQVATQATNAASVPVSGGATPTSPSLALPSVPQFQQQPMNNREVVGAKNAKWQGIGNLITSTTNVVGQFEQKRAQEKQRVMAVDIERVLQANDAINQAQQVLAQDPTNPDANKALAKNKEILNSILSDDKKRKTLAKAFDISFTDPTKNNQPEHKAMTLAAANYADQFRAKMPTSMVPNQQAINKAQEAQANVKAINSAIKDIIPLVTQEHKDANDAANNASRERIEANKQDAENWRMQQRMQEEDKKLSTMVQMSLEATKRAISVATIHGNVSIKKESMAEANRVKVVKMTIDAAEQKVKKLGLTGANAVKIYQASLNEVDRKIKDLPDLINKYEILVANAPDDQSKQVYEAYLAQLRSNVALFDLERKQRQDEIDAALKQEQEQNKNGSGSGVKPADSTRNTGKQNTSNSNWTNDGTFATGAAAQQITNDKPEDPDLAPSSFQ